jgi:serine/threonine-protein kinase
VTPAVRRKLAGRYRLEEVVGRGGMSTVYRATDQALGRTVAVKILLAALAEQDPAYAARFEREARAAAALASSAVVTVYDSGVDGDERFIVMEFVEGRSLDELLRGGRAIEISQALRIAGRVADALACAHAAGILHRDIKPANVMVARDGTVKVLDFGIARRLDGTTITQAASVVGTAAYMAPERALGQPGDARADIYSLGCLLYAMLTGKAPFSGEVSAAVLHQQINAKPLPPSELRAGLSPALDALVLAMLAKSPVARPASAAEVRHEIGTLSRAPSAVIAGAPARAPLLGDHRRRAIVMALVTAALTLIAVALLSGGGASRNGTTASHAARTTRVTTPAARTSTTPAAQTQPQQPAKEGKEGKPPGHGGEPPGPAKKH